MQQEITYHAFAVGLRTGKGEPPCSPFHTGQAHRGFVPTVPVPKTRILFSVPPSCSPHNGMHHVPKKNLADIIIEQAG